MEFKTNSMSSNFLYNRISIFLCMRVDRVCNISQMSPWLCRFQTAFYALLCYTHDTFCSLGHISDLEHTRGI